MSVKDAGLVAPLIEGTSGMVRFLTQTVVNVITAAIALLVANWLVDGMTLVPSGFIITVLVFVVASALLTPFTFNMARQYASAALGGVGLIATLLALFVASLFPGGLSISGFGNWAVVSLIVWFITALGGWAVLAWWTKRRAKAAAAKRAN